MRILCPSFRKGKDLALSIFQRNLSDVFSADIFMVIHNSAIPTQHAYPGSERLNRRFWLSGITLKIIEKTSNCVSSHVWQNILTQNISVSIFSKIGIRFFEIIYRKKILINTKVNIRKNLKKNWDWSNTI